MKNLYQHLLGTSLLAGAVVGGLTIGNYLNTRETSLEPTQKPNEQIVNSPYEENIESVQTGYFLGTSDESPDRKTTGELEKFMDLNSDKENVPGNALESMTSVERAILNYEGFRSHTYIDTKGHPTIGIGFNLDREDASKRISLLGLSYDEVLSGEQEINWNQAMELRDFALEGATRSAENYMGPHWENLPIDAQEILIDMAYNMGGKTLHSFTGLQAELLDNDFDGAAREMRDSEWFSDVKTRSKKLVKIMEEIN